MILRISWRQTGRVDPLRRRGGHRRACSVQTWQPGMQPGRCADLFGAVTMAQWGRTVPAQWGPTQRRRPPGVVDTPCQVPGHRMGPDLEQPCARELERAQPARSRKEVPLEPTEASAGADGQKGNVRPPAEGAHIGNVRHPQLI